MSVDKNGQKLTKHKIAKYGNKLNGIIFPSHRSVTQNIFWAIISQISNQDKTNRNISLDQVVFTYSEIRKLAKYKQTSTAALTRDLKRLAHELGKCQILNDKKTEGFDLFVPFTAFHANSRKKTLTIRVNEEAMPYLTDINKNFTVYYINQLITLQNPFAKTLFRFFMQYRRKRIQSPLRFKIKDLRKYLDTPKSYSNSIFKERRIVPAIKELEDYVDEQGKHIFKSFYFDNKQNKMIMPDEINSKNKNHLIKTRLQYVPYYSPSSSKGGRPAIGGYSFYFIIASKPEKSKKPKKTVRYLSKHKNMPDKKPSSKKTNEQLSFFDKDFD